MSRVVENNALTQVGYPENVCPFRTHMWAQRTYLNIDIRFNDIIKKFTREFGRLNDQQEHWGRKPPIAWK